MGDIMTVKELMEYLKISRSKAYELTKRQGFPVVRIGNAIRIPKQEMEKWIRENIMS